MDFNLGPDLAFSAGRNLHVVMISVQVPCFGIVSELELKKIQDFIFFP